MVISEMRRNCASSSASDGFAGLSFSATLRPRFLTRPVAPGARAAEEFGYSRAVPGPAFAGGDALGIEMIGDGLGRDQPRRLGGFDFDDESPHERLDLLSPLRHIVFSTVLILCLWRDNYTHPRVSATNAVGFDLAKNVFQSLLWT